MTTENAFDRPTSPPSPPPPFQRKRAIFSRDPLARCSCTCVCVSARNPLPHGERADSEYRRLRLSLFHTTPPVRVRWLAETRATLQHANVIRKQARARAVDRTAVLPLSTRPGRSRFASTAVMCAPRFPSLVNRFPSVAARLPVSLPPSVRRLRFRRFRAVRPAVYLGRDIVAAVWISELCFLFTPSNRETLKNAGSLQETLEAQKQVSLSSSSRGVIQLPPGLITTTCASSVDEPIVPANEKILMLLVDANVI